MVIRIKILLMTLLAICWNVWYNHIASALFEQGKKKAFCLLKWIVLTCMMCLTILKYFEDNITRAGKQFLGLHCIPMCSESEGHNCTNIADVHMEFDWTLTQHFHHLSKYLYIMSVVFNSLLAKQPSYLADLLIPYAPSRTLRSSHQHLLHVPFVKSVRGKHAFSFAVPFIGNSLPLSLRTCNSITSSSSSCSS